MMLRGAFRTREKAVLDHCINVDVRIFVYEGSFGVRFDALVQEFRGAGHADLLYLCVRMYRKYDRPGSPLQAGVP